MEQTKYYAANVQDFKDQKCVITTVRNVEIGLFEVNGEYYAWRNVCPHAAAPVCKGKVTGTKMPSDVYEYIYGRDQEILRCPWHGWEFDLVTGEHLADHSVKLKGYEVVRENDDLYVMLRGKNGTVTDP